MQWYLKVLKNYVGFSGRAQRMEFWMFTLINFLINVALSFVDSTLGLSNPETGVGGPIQGLYALAVLLPSIAVAIRRLHDTGRTGWWFLLIFIPVIGWLALLVFYCLDSEPGQNQYGPNPKEAGSGVM